MVFNLVNSLDDFVDLDELNDDLDELNEDEPFPIQESHKSDELEFIFSSH